MHVGSAYMRMTASLVKALLSTVLRSRLLTTAAARCAMQSRQMAGACAQQQLQH
jgi:hypothetical protein